MHTDTIANSTSKRAAAALTAAAALAVALAACSGSSGGTIGIPSGSTTIEIPQEGPGDLLNEIQREIQDNFVEPEVLDVDAAAENAVSAMLQVLHTPLMVDPAAITALSGSYNGIVLEIELEDDQVRATIQDISRDILEKPGGFVDAVYDALLDEFEDPAGSLKPGADAAELAPDAFATAAAYAFVDSLDDRYSSYLTPASYERTQEQLDGSYQGIGANVDVADSGNVVITAFLEGSDGPDAGLRELDEIVGVDGTRVVGLVLDEVVTLVRGDAGTSVTLTVLRDGRELDFTVMRRRISLSNITTDFIEVDGQRFGVIAIPRFARDTSSQFREALCETLGGDDCDIDFCRSNLCPAESGLAGVVIDLRSNPGGFVFSTVDSVSHLLEEDAQLPILYQLNADGSDDYHNVSSVDARFLDTPPLAVLVGPSSASGSEVFAAALHDYGRALLVGETTFGKGSVNNSFPLSNDGALYLTIARWYTPCAHLIEGLGLQPELQAETPEDAARLLLTQDPPAPRCTQFTPPQ